MGNPDRVAVLAHTLSLQSGITPKSFVVDYTNFVHPPTANAVPAQMIEVTGEKTQDAVKRFSRKRIAVLNFASGVSPGGGVRFGARAQEEDLCLCTNLLPELEALPTFYEANQRDDAPSECHDKMIVSRMVTFLKDGNCDLLEEPVLADVITYPAPNMGRHTSNNSTREPFQRTTPREWAERVFERRIAHVLDQAQRIGAEVLILGAWGCGAYGNDPKMVSRLFMEGLTASTFEGTVVFAVYGDKRNQDAFHQTFRC